MNVHVVTIIQRYPERIRLRYTWSVPVQICLQLVLEMSTKSKDKKKEDKVRCTAMVCIYRGSTGVYGPSALRFLGACRWLHAQSRL